MIRLPLPRLQYSIVALCLAACLTRSTQAGMLNVLATADGTATDKGRDGIFESVNPSGLGIQAIWDSNLLPGDYNFETRGFVEFSLAGLAPTDTVVSATLLIDVYGHGWHPADPKIPIRFVGYAGDGAIGLADATTAGTVVSPLHDYYEGGAYTSGLTEIALNPGYVQSLLGISNFLGIRVETITSATYSMLGFYSLDYPTVPGVIEPHYPTLRVEFTPAVSSPVPEPAGLILVATAVATLLAAHRLRADLTQRGEIATKDKKVTTDHTD